METICVDIGNSGLRCVRIKPGASLSAAKDCPWWPTLLRVDWQAVRADEQQAPKIISDALDLWLAQQSIQHHACSWLISSVQRQMESCLRQYVSHRPTDQVRVVSYHQLKLEVMVDQPERVGIDRLLAASAAQLYFPDESLVVVQAGSAITVDWLQATNRFCGGAIMPGVPMMLRLLSQAADLLPEVAADELLQLPPLPGRNTQAAMRAGVSSAVVGGVRHLIERYREQAGPSVRVVLSGGDGPLLYPHLAPPCVVVDHLVLRGLAHQASLIS